MKKFGSVWALTLAVASAFPLMAVADGVKDHVVSSSRQTYNLTPGSPAYAAWAAWIKQQQAKTDIPQLVKGVGAITITVESANSGSQVAATSSLSSVAAPVDAGPAVGLPVTGTPGQKITITSQLPNGGYQAWVYQYQGGPSGGGGGSWAEVGSGACTKPHCSVSITTKPG